MTAMPGRETEYTCSMPAMRDSTCSAGRVTSASTSLVDAPGKGTKTFAMVTLICGSSSRGVIKVAPMPSNSAISAIRGVREFLRKYSAMRPEMPTITSQLTAIVDFDAKTQRRGLERRSLWSGLSVHRSGLLGVFAFSCVCVLAACYLSFSFMMPNALSTIFSNTCSLVPFLILRM